MSTIAIIIPTYHCTAYLAQCVQGVREQSYRDWELVIVDDGSRDETYTLARQLAEGDSRIKVYRQENAGVAATRNRGAQLAGEEASHLLFLDNDDWLEPDALENLWDGLRANSGTAACYGLPRFVDRDGEPITREIERAYGYPRRTLTPQGLRVLADEEQAGFGAFIVWPPIATPGQVLIRRDCFERTGGFDLETVPSDDWYLWLRLSAERQLAFTKKFVINKRLHAENVSGKGKVMARAEPIIRARLARDESLRPEQRRLVRMGHFYSCHTKLTWAGQELAKGRLVEAAKGVYRASRSLLRYAGTRYD